MPTILRALQGDITLLAVDAIVNAANSSFLGGGGVDSPFTGRPAPNFWKNADSLVDVMPGMQN